MAARDLPTDFLTQSRAGIVAAKIDFSETDLPEYAACYACVLDNVLSSEECASLRRAVEETADGVWERAMVNIGSGKQAMMPDLRNSGRIIWDSQTVASRVWQRIENVPEVQEVRRLQAVPTITGRGPNKRNEVWTLTRPNERMRFLKYTVGEFFAPHTDGMYETPDRCERSYFTLHLYLGDSGMPPEEKLDDMSVPARGGAAKAVTIGGATTFHGMDMHRKLDIEPKLGRILLFQQRDLLHSGDVVVKGVKYTMRTDMMYALEQKK